LAASGDEVEAVGEHVAGVGVTPGGPTGCRAFELGGDDLEHCYDAVAIPVALGATARATTTCPTCQADLVIDIDEGHLRDGLTPVLWMPLGPCEHVIDDFCVNANLFCGPDHIHTWRHAASDPHGEVVTLAEVPAIARTAWADIAARP
jgi:hypothetical protein